MRIVIVANDTRGGIQPYVALGQGLRRSGHEITVVAPADYGPMLDDAGLDHAPLSGRVEDLLRSAAGAGERGTLAAMRLAGREMAPRVVTWTRETLEASEGADILTGGIGGKVVGLAVADRLGVPFVEAHLQPVGAPTAAYPGALFGSLPGWIGPIGRRASHTLTELGLRLPFLAGVRAGRESLGLLGRSTAAHGQPVLYGFSRHVVPVPRSRTRPRHVTGWWFHDAPAAWVSPEGLDDFLARPGPVVSIGFGSMAAEDPAATARFVLGAIRRAGVRAVLVAGWGGLAAPHAHDTDDVFAIDAIPYDRLFPRVAAIIHHGGAGTTGAALRAGVPSIVVPFAVDQPFWASRVAALGVGPAPIPRRRLTEEGLAGGISQALGDDGMRTRAARLGELIRAEDGVGTAVRVFDDVAASRSVGQDGRPARKWPRSGPFSDDGPS